MKVSRISGKVIKLERKPGQNPELDKYFTDLLKDGSREQPDQKHKTPRRAGLLNIQN